MAEYNELLSELLNESNDNSLDDLAELADCLYADSNLF